MEQYSLRIAFAVLAVASLVPLAGHLLLPAVLRALRRMRPAPAKEAGAVARVTVVVPAYNEEGKIAAKIDTLKRAIARVDVPVEVLIGSDGSTDRTAEVVRANLAGEDPASWKLHEFPNEGKCSTLNKLVALAAGDVIVATDADIPVPEDSLALVVQAFRADRALGCVSCVPCFEAVDVGRQKSYWSLEDRIRQAESAWGRQIVVTGMLAAFRKEAYVPIPAGVMADDLWIPLNVLLQGRASAQIDALRVPYEKTDEQTEIARRRRVMVGGMDVVRRLWARLRERPAVLALVLAHKVWRWALPLWLVLFLVALVPFAPWLLALYAAGAVALLLLPRTAKPRMLARTVFSPAFSFAEVLRRKDFARWEHTRKD